MQHYHVRHPRRVHELQADGTFAKTKEEWWSEKKGWGDRKDATLFSAVELNRLIDSMWASVSPASDSSHTSHAWAESHFPNTLKAYIAGTLSLDPRQTVPVSDLEILSLAKSNGKKKAKRKKARAAKKRRQQRAVERGDVQVTRRSGVAESMMLRRMGTGGSGAHGPSRRQQTRATRRKAKQEGYTNDNPRKLKTFKASRAPIRWRRITKSLPKHFVGLEPEEGEREVVWVGYTKIPSGVLERRKLSDVEMLAEALEPDWKEGQWSQHVMVARTPLEPGMWKRAVGQWRGPDPDRFEWQQVGSGRPDDYTLLWHVGRLTDLLEPPQHRVGDRKPLLQPGEAIYKLHKTYPLAQENPRYGSLPAIGHAKEAIRQAGFDYDSIEFVREARGASGPVYVFRAVKRGVLYDINAGRPIRSDYVEVRSAPAKVEGPAQLPLFGKKNPYSHRQRKKKKTKTLTEYKGWHRGTYRRPDGKWIYGWSYRDGWGTPPEFRVTIVKGGPSGRGPWQANLARLDGWGGDVVGPAVEQTSFPGKWGRDRAAKAAVDWAIEQTADPLFLLAQEGEAKVGKENPPRKLPQTGVLSWKRGGPSQARGAVSADVDVAGVELTYETYPVPAPVRKDYPHPPQVDPSRTGWQLVWYGPETSWGATPILTFPNRKAAMEAAEAHFQSLYPLAVLSKANPYRSAVIGMPSAAQLNPARRNMRKDMPKVLVTTPRHGHDVQSPDTRRRRRERITEEHEGPSRAPMKPLHGHERRVLNEYLNPLRRYLQRNAGRPWDEVYSEIRAANPPHSAVSAHIYEHLWDYVELHPVITEKGVFKPAEAGWQGSPVAIAGEWAFYVDYDGILREAPDPRGYAARYRERQEAAGLHLEKRSGQRYATWQKKDPNVKKVDDLTYLLRRPSDGVWFEVSYRPVVESRIGERPMTPGRKLTKGLTFPHVPGHYPISVRSLSRKEKKAHAVENPGLESDFDPREWQTHAQVDKIYGTFMEKMYGADGFRSPDNRQLRLDAMVLMRSKNKDQVIAQSRDKLGKAFGTTIKRGQQYGWFYPGTRTPTPKTAKKSLQRYQGHYKGSDGKVRTLDDLVNGRQSYEETLGFSRKSGFYRITQEPTQSGPRWFVWPMVPGQRIPGPGASQTEAQRLADKLNRTADPRATNEWHVPECNYTKAELAGWLPPARVFESRPSFLGPGDPRVPVAPKPKRKARPAAPRRGKPAAPSLSAKGEMRSGQLVYFIVDKSGQQVSPDYFDWDAVWAELQKRQAA